MGRYKIYREGDILTQELQGLVYTCPPLPDPSTIRGYNLPRSEQIWTRRTEYEDFEWNVNPKEGKLWWIDCSDEQTQFFWEEISRLNLGDWVYINGVPTYFNKYCYFFHQWHTLQEGIHPQYKDVSLEYFRFYQLCEDDPNCVGDCGIKGRRVGLSSMSASIKLLIALLEDNTIQGIVSKTGTDAQEMFLFVKFSLENLPPFLMPDLNKVTESEIHVAKPAKKISKNNTKATADKGKNNRIDYRDTSENAYDQSRKRHMTIDEAAKWIKVNVLIFLSKVMETVVVGASVVGHISLFSTVNKGDKGGNNFRVIWDGSNHIDGKKDNFGRTQFRMKRFFIEGYRGLYGYIGKFGESIIDTPTPEQQLYLSTFIDPSTGKLACAHPTIGARQYLEETRKMNAHDPELLAEEKRKYPFRWEEVFEGANNQCHFNLKEVNDQIERLEAKLEGTNRKENGRRIRFKNPNEWVDDAAGMWWVLKFPDRPHKAVFKGSIKCPDNTDFGAAGLDTYHNARATVEKGSDACLIISSRYNALEPDTSGKPVAMFLGRPLTKKEFHDQVFWGLQHFGVKMLAERSPTDWEDYATDATMRLASPNDAVKKFGYLCVTRRANDSEVYGVAAQDNSQREQHLTEMIEYANHNIHKIEFLAILRNMISFNIKDRTDYDACMAWGYSLMALKSGIKEIKAPKKNNLHILSVFHKSA